MKTKSSLLMPFRLSNLFLLLFLIFSMQVQAGADSYFNPTNRDQLNVTLPSGNVEKYNYVDFRIFSHTSTPYSDRMNTITMSYQDAQGGYVEFMSYGMANFDSNNSNPFSKTTFGNSVNTGVVTYLGHVNGSNTDLRYLNFRWFYPSNLGGKTVKFKCDWKWELDWWCCSKWSSGTDYNLSIALPVYNPAQLSNPVLKTIDGSGDGKWFNFKWDSYDASLGSTVLELYNDNTYSTKLYTTPTAT
ncbi:MAG: hypothetical protein PHD30_00345 [Paludibacter sp.]|nr:hypothetical protein [Paludibacter sp.]